MSGAQWYPQGNFYWQVLCGIGTPSFRTSLSLCGTRGLEVLPEYIYGGRSVILNPQL